MSFQNFRQRLSAYTCSACVIALSVGTPLTPIAAFAELSPPAGTGALWVDSSLAQSGIAQSTSISGKNWETARLVRTIADSQLVPGSLNLTAISPDNQIIASAIKTDPSQYADGVRAWDIDTGRELYTLPAHQPFISAIAFSPNGQLLATGEYNHDRRMLMIRLWDAKTGRLVRSLQRAVQPRFRNGGYFHNAIFTFSPDSQTLYSTATNPVIQEWDVSTGRLRRSLTGYRETIRALRVSPDGRMLASTHVDGKISWLNLQTGQVLHTPTGGLDGFELGFSPDGQTVAGTFSFEMNDRGQQVENRQIGIWNTNTGTLVHSIAGLNKEEWLIFSPDGKTFAAANYQSNIRLYDLQTGQQIRAFRGPSTNIAFSPDGQLFVTVTTRGIKIWR